MKKRYTKDYMLSLRVSGTLIDRIDDLTELFQLDRADLIRMLLSNSVKFWENHFSKKGTIPVNVNNTGYNNQFKETEHDTSLDDEALEQALKQLK